MMEDCIKNILIKQGNEEPTFDDVKKFYDKRLHPDIIDLKDKNVFEEIFHKGNWAGIFQFTEKGAQKFCEKTKPNSLVDISAITSIFRPGPLSAGVVQQYISAKEGTQYVEYFHPIHKKITSETHGFLIFQEQIALLAHKLGKNISLDEGNKLRKLLVKKGSGKGHEEKDKIYKKFIQGCAEKRIPNSHAEKLWETFEYFSGYGFNKSHAVSYSMLSYQCAYLFHYYPIEWMSAFLDKEPETRKEKAITIAKGAGFNIVPVDVNRSGFVWEIEGNNTLIQPLTSIKGLGEKAIEQIIKNRPFNTIEEFLFHDKMVYSKVNKRVLDVLVRSQALNGLVDGRFTGLKHFWSSVAVDRARKVEQFHENIIKYEPEGEFEEEEKIEHIVSLTGLYPFDIVLNKAVVSGLQDHRVPPLSEFDPDLMVAWFILRDIISKKTKNGKEYWILECIDNAGGMNSIRCWGVRPEDKKRILINRPYMAKLEYSQQWGFSTRSIKYNFRPLG